MAKKSEIYHPTKENKSFASIFFCRQTFTVIAISFAPCSIILSISLGVTNIPSPPFYPLITEVETTVGIPIEITGIPRVFSDISYLWLPTPEPGEIPALQS